MNVVISNTTNSPWRQQRDTAWCAAELRFELRRRFDELKRKSARRTLPGLGHVVCHGSRTVEAFKDRVQKQKQNPKCRSDTPTELSSWPGDPKGSGEGSSKCLVIILIYSAHAYLVNYQPEHLGSFLFSGEWSQSGVLCKRRSVNFTFGLFRVNMKWTYSKLNSKNTTFKVVLKYLLSRISFVPELSHV